MRYDAEVSIFVNPKKFMEDGNVLYQSASGALISGDVSPIYIEAVVDNTTGATLWSKEYHDNLVAELSSQKPPGTALPTQMPCRECAAPILLGQLICHACGHNNLTAI